MGHETKIMGILNCTPDSFSGDGKIKINKAGTVDTGACLFFADKIIHEGADILDIGGESTRPEASPVPLQEEIKRVIPVIDALARRTAIPISVDTSKMEVARRALDAGAVIINNIKGTRITKGFLRMVRDYQAAIVLMHMRGTPATMKAYARYKDVVKEVLEELQISIEKCLEIGIKRNRIIIDPGIGFAKDMAHSLTLINHLNALNVLRCPILLGTSRKSFIGQILEKEADGRLMGTAATVAAGIMRGAHILRVHDVKAMKETAKVTDVLLKA
ncbi:MAG: dihydropteroate synthase [Candidatus Omnitrophica bacterium]|nr:dihydropteroate synthase [Candidatus Omnitrophota bacterium]